MLKIKKVLLATNILHIHEYYENQLFKMLKYTKESINSSI